MNMNLWSLHSSPNPFPSTISFLHKNPGLFKPRNCIPARDRVIDFGKYRGKMLGTLPSNYLKWVSKNLRARDFEEWAKLADEVLDDPVYKDRVEWEFAQKLLNGDVLKSSKAFQQQSAVSDLLEISERFGWDNEDKVGWAKLDFGLLGTSKGGRIPRVSLSGSRPNNDNGLEIGKPKLGENGPVVDGRRRERRERSKLRRNNNGERSIKDNFKGNIGNSSKIKLEGNDDDDDDSAVEIESKKSAFPGREALLKKVVHRRRF